MTKLLGVGVKAGAALMLLACATVTNATTYQDWWYNPSLSGMGLNVGQQGQNVFVSWYLYDPDQDPSFLIFYGDLKGNTLTAPLRRFYGPEPHVYDETLWGGEIVGTATITFSSPSAGKLDYDYDGKQGSYPIQRYTFHPINMSGIYYGGSILTITNCGANDGNISYPDVYTITHSGNSLEVVEPSTGCVYKGEVQQKGTHFTGSGTYSCAGTGDSGSWTLTDVVTTEFGYTAQLAAQNKFGCQLNGRVGGVK
jgi:hypothetical protein